MQVHYWLKLLAVLNQNRNLQYEAKFAARTEMYFHEDVFDLVTSVEREDLRKELVTPCRGC